MLLKTKDLLKSNKHIESIARKLALPLFWLSYKGNDIQAYCRQKNITRQPKFEYLKKLKDAHKGERCFIVATGPSLSFDDLNMIKDEFSLGMNSCALALDKTDWTPNYLGIQDEYVYKNIESKLISESKNRLKNKILVASFIPSIFPSAKDFLQFPLHFLDHKYNRKTKGEIKFSDDCYSIIYDGYSIIFSMMQLAVYMGFSEIYLIGCDCNYSTEKLNFIEHGAPDPFRHMQGGKLIYSHSLFSEFAKKKGVQIFNCTRGGMLEVYPRKKLEDVLKNR